MWWTVVLYGPGSGMNCRDYKSLIYNEKVIQHTLRFIAGQEAANLADPESVEKASHIKYMTEAKSFQNKTRNQKTKKSWLFFQKSDAVNRDLWRQTCTYSRVNEKNKQNKVK